MLTPGRLAITTNIGGISPLIRFIGSGSLATSDVQGETKNIPWPSGYTPVSGDVVVITAVGYLSVAESSPSTDAPTPSGGFTRLSTVWSGSGATAAQTTVFYRVLNGTESVPQFTNTSSTTIYGTLGIGYASTIFRGVDQTNPIDTSATTSSGQTPSSGSITFTPTGVGTTNRNSLVINVVGISNDGDLILGLTKDYSASISGTAYSTEVGSDFGMGLAYKFVRDPSSASTVDIPTWLQTFGFSDYWGAISFSLRGAPVSGSLNEVQDSHTLSGSVNVRTGGLVNSTQANHTLTSSSFFGARGLLSKTQDNQTIQANAFFGWKIVPGSIDGSDTQPGVDVLAVLDQYFYPTTVRTDVEPLGPENISLFDPLNPPPEYTPRVTAKLIARDGQTIVSDLPNAFGIEWREALNEHGFGKISIPSSDPTAELLTPGRYVRCFLDGVARFTWLIEAQPERVIVSNDEEYGEVTTAQGRGWIARLDYALVYPEGGITNPLNPQHRLFSFASPSFPNFSGWSASSYVEGKAGSILPPRTIVGSEKKLEPAPEGFPDPDAYWIWATPQPHAAGKCYFLRAFTNPVAQGLKIAASADNFYTLYLDGVPILGETEDGFGWRSYKEIVVELPAGTYLLGVVAENQSLASPGNNPAGFVLTIYPFSQPAQSNSQPYPGDPPRIQLGMRSSNVALVQARLNALGFNSGPVDGYFGPITDAAVRAFQAKYAPPVDGWVGPITWAALFDQNVIGVANRLVWSDSNFASLAYPATPPGWTPGQILDQLLIDSYSRSASLYIGNTTWGIADSDGQAWNTGPNNFWTYAPNFSVPIGSTVLSAIDTLASDGWIDYKMRPGRLFFDAYNPKKPDGSVGYGSLTNVTYEKNVNIKSLTFDISEPKINRVVVKWTGGWYVVENTSDITTNGAHERFMTVNTDDFNEARRMGDLTSSELSDPQHAIVVEVEPRSGYNETPYKNFNIRDKVYAPSPSGSLAHYRVIAISVQQDEMGDPLFTLELNKRSRIIERQQFELLQSLSGGLIGPNSTSSLDVSNPTSYALRSGVL